MNINSPVSSIDDYLRRGAHSLNGARAVLVVATVVLMLLFVQATFIIGRRWLAAILAVLTLVALPAQTAYSFTRLFRANGTAGRPLTLDQGTVFDWVDRTVGRGADVTMLPYPQLPGDYWASVASWWDVEFWNASVDRAAYYPGQFVVDAEHLPGAHAALRSADRRLRMPRRRASCSRPTSESRFRISGAVVTAQPRRRC